MLHHLLQVWFGWVEHGGYSGVVLLMALESSIIPVPSEIVMPPAAFWAAQGKMSLAGVIAAGTLGSYLGSVANFWFFRWIGMPLLERYGKYILLPKEKIRLAQRWILAFGAPGIFIARFLPVIRHLISIPAGILRMPFVPFSVATIVGAGLWCGVLAWFGQSVLGAHPELLDSPEAMMAAVKAQLHWFVIAVVALAILYGVVVWFSKKDQLKKAAVLVLIGFGLMAVQPPAARAVENPLFAYTHLLPSPFTLSAGRLAFGTNVAIGVTDFFQIGTALIPDIYKIWNVEAKLALVDTEIFALALTLGYQTYNENDIVFSNPEVQVTSWLPGGVMSFALQPTLALFLGGNLNFTKTAIDPATFQSSGFVTGATGESDLSFAYHPQKRRLGNVLSAGASYDFTYKIYGIGLSHHWPGFHVGFHYYPNASQYKILPILSGGAVVDI